MKIKPENLLRSVRLAISMLVGLGITRTFHIAHPLWLYITLVVVLFDQSTVGGALLRGYIRVGATVLSAVIGFIILLLSHGNQFIIESCLIIGVTIYAYFFMDSKHSYIGVLGSMTLIMILVNDVDTSLNVPLIRVIAIVFGTIIAILTMILFFPRYAKDNINNHIITSLGLIEKTFRIFIDHHQYTLHQIEQHILAIESGLVREINKFWRWNDEMRYEMRPKTKTNYTKVFLYIRRINRLLTTTFQNLPSDNVRHDIALSQAVENLATIFKELHQNMHNKITNNHHQSLNTIPIPTLMENTNNELIFIYFMINRIIQETKSLVVELEVL